MDKTYFSQIQYQIANFYLSRTAKVMRSYLLVSVCLCDCQIRYDKTEKNHKILG